MRRRIPGLPVLPFGAVSVLLAGGAAHFAWEHEQGLHERANVLCLICWMAKVAPAPETPGDSGPSQPPESS
jgi:hypothetical protein